MYKSDLPTRLGTELFPQTTFQPGAVQISISLSRPQEGDARRAYESLSASIISHHTGELNAFFVAQRSNAQNGITQQHFAKKDFNPHISAIYLYSFGMEWLRIIVRPEKYKLKEKGAYILVMYAGNRVAMLAYEGGGFSTIYNATLRESSWGSEKIKTNQLRFAGQNSTWVFWPINYIDAVFSLAEQYNCTQTTENGLKSFIPSNTPYPQIDGTDTYPIMNGDAATLYTPNDVFFATSDGSISVTPRSYDNVFAISSSGDVYNNQIVRSSVLMMSSTGTTDHMALENFIDTAPDAYYTIAIYGLNGTPIYDICEEQGDILEMSFPYMCVSANGDYNSTSIRFAPEMVWTPRQWNDGPTSYADNIWPQVMGPSDEGWHTVLINLCCFPPAYGDGRYEMVSGTDAPFDFELGAFASSVMVVHTPYLSQTLERNDAAIVGWLNVSDGTHLIQAFGIGVNPVYYIYMDGTDIGPKLAAIPDLGMSVSNIQAILFDVSLEFVMGLK